MYCALDLISLRKKLDHMNCNTVVNGYWNSTNIINLTLLEVERKEER